MKKIHSYSDDEGPVSYSARDGYRDYSIGVDYERLRFSGPLGRYRRWREERAFRQVMREVPRDISILDCPCGTGRWWPELSVHARQIAAIDVSPGMLRHASERVHRGNLSVMVVGGDAVKLPFRDGAVDYAFSFALTKHLPRQMQYRVLRELARVARRGVVCTFGIFGHLSYEVWRRRGIRESYPLFVEELDWMASEAGLRVEERRKCTTPVGVEQIVRFSRVDS